MTTEIQFELVSPEEKLVSEGVYLVEIPGDDGSFGVMAGHCSLVSSLRAGVVTLHKSQGGDTRKIFIAGGFADVTAANCTVLAEEAIDVQNLNKDSLEQYLSDLNEDLNLAEEAHDKKRVSGKIAVTKAKIAAVA
ncbi:MAG: ATP synthase F1 subunit epsilon [Alphaproteobacteria bacterium]